MQQLISNQVDILNFAQRPAEQVVSSTKPVLTKKRNKEMGKTTEQLKKEDKDKKCRTQLAQMHEMLDQADDTIVIDSDCVSTNLNQNCCKVCKL